MVSGTRLEKTSVQLPPDTLREMDAWPGLTRSEAIRLSVERAYYFATLESEEIAGIAHRFAPILGPALTDLDYDDYRLAARALPAIVEGFLREHSGVSFPDLDGRSELNPHEALETLQKLDVMGRVGVLDCVVAERRRASVAGRKRRARR